MGNAVKAPVNVFELGEMEKQNGSFLSEYLSRGGISSCCDHSGVRAVVISLSGNYFLNRFVSDRGLILLALKDQDNIPLPRDYVRTLIS